MSKTDLFGEIVQPLKQAIADKGWKDRVSEYLYNLYDSGMLLDDLKEIVTLEHRLLGARVDTKSDYSDEGKENIYKTKWDEKYQTELSAFDRWQIAMGMSGGTTQIPPPEEFTDPINPQYKAITFALSVSQELESRGLDFVQIIRRLNTIQDDEALKKTYTAMKDSVR